MITKQNKYHLYENVCRVYNNGCTNCKEGLGGILMKLEIHKCMSHTDNLPEFMLSEYETPMEASK